MNHPNLAEDDKILATPTLIKILPPPVRRIIGDLSNKEKVLLGLDLVAVRWEKRLEKINEEINP